VLSGDDPLTLPMMAVGAVGVISVASNVAPEPVSEMVHHALAGRWEEALAIHRRYFPLFQALLTLDTNPVPVKTALAMMGRVEEVFRLPLCGMSDDARDALQRSLERCGVLAGERGES
jgi:4-hydroxy-tetrahydrodipicolinate synthase